MQPNVQLQHAVELLIRSHEIHNMQLMKTWSITQIIGGKARVYRRQN